MNEHEADALAAQLSALPWPDPGNVEITAVRQYMQPDWEVQVRHEVFGLLHLWYGSGFVQELASALAGWQGASIEEAR